MRLVNLVIAVILIIFGVLVGRNSVAKVPENKLDQLTFLAGSWHRQAGNTTMEEHWTRPSGGCMMGLMRQVTDGTTGVREFLLLEETDDGVVMTVKHVGSRFAEVPGRTFHMKLTDNDGREAIFQNTGSGSLRRVIYRKQDDGGLYAAIQVDRNGQLRDIEMPFKPMKK